MSEDDHDPLDFLQTAISTSTLPTLLTAALEPCESLSLAAYLSFPSPSSAERINLTKTRPTRFARTDERDDFYTLGQLWLAWTERQSAIRDYMEKFRAEGEVIVAWIDKKIVADYLEGTNTKTSRVVPKDADGKAVLDPATTSVSATAEALPTELDSVAGPSRPAAVAKRKYEVNQADLEFCKKLRSELIELGDRNSVLRCSNGGKVNNFESFAKNVMVEKIRAMRKSMDGPSGRPSTAASQSQTIDPARGPKKARAQNPIIMISSSPTALITMWNVRKFLVDGIFEPSETARQNEMALGNYKPEDMIPITHTRPGPGNTEINDKYYIIDSVDTLQKFGQDAWDRVICVLTTGQAWQFRPYKWQDPKSLFRHVKGVYFQWNSEPANPSIRDWNVVDLRIDKLKRHTDKQVVANFWRIMESGKRR